MTSVKRTINLEDCSVTVSNAKSIETETGEVWLSPHQAKVVRVQKSSKSSKIWDSPKYKLQTKTPKGVERKALMPVKTVTIEPEFSISEREVYEVQKKILKMKTNSFKMPRVLFDKQMIEEVNLLTSMKKEVVKRTFFSEKKSEFSNILRQVLEKKDQENQPHTAKPNHENLIENIVDKENENIANLSHKKLNSEIKKSVFGKSQNTEKPINVENNVFNVKRVETMHQDTPLLAKRTPFINISKEIASKSKKKLKISKQILQENLISQLHETPRQSKPYISPIERSSLCSIRPSKPDNSLKEFRKFVLDAKKECNKMIKNLTKKPNTDQAGSI